MKSTSGSSGQIVPLSSITFNNDSKQFPRFVSNRIRFIRASTDVSQWRYVPSAMNPADHLSRGVSVAKFLQLGEWNRGPEFLSHRHEFWPQQNWLNSPPSNDLETNDKKLCLKVVLNEDSPTEKLLHSSSCWYKLKRRVAWFRRFIATLMRNTENMGRITLKEIDNAEIAILRFVQKSAFCKEIKALTEKKLLHRNSELRKLDPFIDDNEVMRVGGRLQNSVLPEYTKHQIILPNKDSNVAKLMRYEHRSLGHMGRSTTIASLRRKYWILGVNAAVKRLQYNCVVCRRINANAHVQKMSPLPADRVRTDEPAFSNTGIDFFGYFEVTNGRKREKRYGIVFTCLSTRAIHLEMAHSLTTDSFINGFRRFVSRRGNVRTVRSDNGTNLTSGNEELRNSLAQWNEVAVNDWMLQHNIDWRFSPPSASHFGGAYEREIRAVRKVLDSLLLEQPIKLSDEQLCTLLCEIESILNCRPITEQSDDCNDLEPLTPNHLLLLHSGATFPPGLFSRDDCFARRRWKQIQYLADIFWTRYRKEYLPIMQLRQKWFRPKYNFKAGDLVLLTEQNLPRNQWATGRVIKVYTGADGHVRVVRLKIAKYRSKKIDANSLQISEVDRPVTRLILLKTFD